MPEPIIQIKGLTKRFGDLTAVDDFDLTVNRGEMFSLVGPDGAGKTTIVRMLCGILMPDEGEVSVLGYDLLKQTAEIKRNIGYLSQQFSLYGDLTIDENIEFFAELHGVAGYRERRKELLAFTRLGPFRGRLADRLSGGMKQKLALACTLIHTPRIIFLDEPTTGVDPVSRRDFWKILSDLLKRDITIVMTTPYLDEAERCSRVGLLDHGSLMVADTPQRIRSRLKGQVLEVVCDRVRDAAGILRSSGMVEEVQAFGDRLHAVADEPEGAADRVGNLLQDGNITIRDIRTVTPSLENVFISLVRKRGVVR